MNTKSFALPSSKEESGRHLRGIALFSVLGAMMLTLLLEALDQTIVGTALPRIIGSLQGFDRYTWAVTAYILASVVQHGFIAVLLFCGATLLVTFFLKDLPLVQRSEYQAAQPGEEGAESDVDAPALP